MQQRKMKHNLSSNYFYIRIAPDREVFWCSSLWRREVMAGVLNHATVTRSCDSASSAAAVAAFFSLSDAFQMRPGGAASFRRTPKSGQKKSNEEKVRARRLPQRKCQWIFPVRIVFHFPPFHVFLSCLFFLSRFLEHSSII